jgi:hypothetical protein
MKPWGWLLIVAVGCIGLGVGWMLRSPEAAPTEPRYEYRTVTRGYLSMENGFWDDAGRAKFYEHLDSEYNLSHPPPPPRSEPTDPDESPSRSGSASKSAREVAEELARNKASFEIWRSGLWEYRKLHKPSEQQKKDWEAATRKTVEDLEDLKNWEFVRSDAVTDGPAFAQLVVFRREKPLAK